MPPYNKIRYDGEFWNYVYLDFDPFLPEEDAEHLVWNMIDMRHKNIEQRDLQGESYEGRIKQKQRAVLASFVGQLFDVELDTNSRGKTRMSVLLIDRVDPSLN